MYTFRVRALAVFDLRNATIAFLGIVQLYVLAEQC